MKKIISMVLSVTLAISSMICVSAADEGIKVYIDNQKIVLKDANGNQVYPFIQNGTTYVPLRGISETLNCNVIWDGNNNAVLIYKDIASDNSVFRNNSDEIVIYVDNQLVELKDVNGTKVKPFIKNGTTYVPLRGVSQALGCWVRWNGQNKMVSIYMDNCPPDGVSLTENKPYKSEAGIGYIHNFYETDGSQLEIDGTYYTNAIYWEYTQGYSESIHINGKFKYATMIIGRTDNDSYSDIEQEIFVKFVVDEEIIKTCIIEPNAKSKEIKVPLNYGLDLKIVAQNGSSVGLGDIVFWGE